MTGPRRFAEFFATHDMSLRTIGATIDVAHQTVNFWKQGLFRPHPVHRMRLQEAIGLPSPSWATAREIRIAKLIVATHDARRDSELVRDRSWSVWRRCSLEDTALITMRCYLILGIRPPLRIAKESLLVMDRDNAILRDADAIGKFLIEARRLANDDVDSREDLFGKVLEAAKLGDRELISRGLPTELPTSEEPVFDGTFDFSDFES